VSKPRQRRVALVVGSGGLKCVAALGLWRVLTREGIDIDLAVGCSGGSIYVSMMTLGWSLERAIETTHELWRDRFRRRNRGALLKLLLPRLFGFDRAFALIDDRAVNEAVHTTFGNRRIEEAASPLFIVATDFTSGDRVVLSSGPVWEAVRASIAIPLMLKPWEIAGRCLVDGGMSDPLPVDVAIREGVDVIIAMGFEGATFQELDAPGKLILQTSTLAMNHLLRSSFAFYNLAHHAEVIPIIPSFDCRVGLGDTHLIPYLIEEGERAAEREVPYLRRLLGSV